MDRIVIIGNGIAGLSAAKTIRKKNKKVEVLMISEEKYVTYDRTLLSDYLSIPLDKTVFNIETKKWYEENNIELKLGIHINSINTENKMIISSNGEAIHYNKLILANGSKNCIPPIEGINLKGVFTLKNLDDAKEIVEYSKVMKKCVIIGGGILGFEAAFELPESGVDVTVICANNRIIERQLDIGASKHVLNKVLEHGVKVILNNRAVGIIGSKSVEGVKLSDGQIIPCDFVLISTGIKPNISICDNTDIAINKGILVNSFMETSVENIYAAGDACEYSNQIYGIWTSAVRQGETAGNNAIGIKSEFHEFVPSNLFDAFDIKFFSIGKLEQANCDEYCSYIIDEHCKSIYKKLVFKNDILIGGILIGDFTDQSKIEKGIIEQVKRNKFVKECIK